MWGWLTGQWAIHQGCKPPTAQPLVWEAQGAKGEAASQGWEFELTALGGRRVQLG